jgi:L-asparagine transporter-like permease
MSVKTLEEHVAAFPAFMDLFGKRAAALYSVFCVVACVVPAVILLIWSPTALFSSVVSIVWMGGLFIVGGISLLWCELNEERVKEKRGEQSCLQSAKRECEHMQL